MVDKPENQADDYADDQARDDREIKGAVFAAIPDVTGQTTEVERRSWSEVEECADEDEHCSDREEKSPELLDRFHAHSLALG